MYASLIVDDIYLHPSLSTAWGMHPSLSTAWGSSVPRRFLPQKRRKRLLPVAQAAGVLRPNGTHANGVLRPNGTQADEVLRSNSSHADGVLRSNGTHADAVLRPNGTQARAEGEVLDLILAPGDVAIFHPNLIHGSPASKLLNYTLI